MEIRNEVYHAARQGNLYRLGVFLNHLPKEEIADLVSSQVDGSTPLIAACRNGHLNVVYYLIEECHADIEQVGSVIFDDEIIEDAPPLWCAVAAGHLNVAKFLIANKASVNKTTKTSSTPLRAACYEGSFKTVKFLMRHGADINKANSFGHTCLMIACFRGFYKIAKYLIDHGADVNIKNLSGFTALHESAMNECGNLEIVKLLMEHGAKFDYDTSGTSPLLSAADYCNAAIVEYFLEKVDCAKLEKINALELLGAAFLDRKSNKVLAHDCWKRAMELRYEDVDSPIEKPITQSFLASYFKSSEVRSISELDNLIYNIDEMRIQAILVRGRILHPSHPQILHCILKKGVKYFEKGKFYKCFQLWIYVLDKRQDIEEPLDSDTLNLFFNFVKFFSFIISNPSYYDRGSPAVSFTEILHVFEKSLKEIQTAMEFLEKKGQDFNQRILFHHTLMCALYFVSFMCRLKSRLNESEELKLKITVHQLVRMNPRNSKGWTPLHLACSTDSSLESERIAKFIPSPEVVDLLLEVGACPNVVDVDNNAPLHISAMNEPFSPAVFQSLLKHGAHLDVCNHKRQTPLLLAQEKTPFLDIYPLQYINLQCLCVQAIRTHNISYKGCVQKKLEVFLDGH